MKNSSFPCFFFFFSILLIVSLFLKWQPHVVVNCAAISVPRACEKDPATAMSINVPRSLINWLSSFQERYTLLIHLSTDQGRCLILFLC